MAWALVHKDKVVEVKEEKFPVNENMEWIEVNPSEVKENYLYVENAFVEPEHPIIQVVEPESINHIDQMIQTLADYCLGKINKESLESTFENYMVVVNNVSANKS